MAQKTFRCTLTDALKPMVGMTVNQEVFNTIRTTIANIVARDIAGVDEYSAFYAPYIPLQFYEKDTRVFAKKPMNFSRAKWYKVEVDPIHMLDARDWCVAQFGPQPRVPDAWTRWQADGWCRLTFRDEKDYQWFVLRWGA